MIVYNYLKDKNIYGIFDCYIEEEGRSGHVIGIRMKYVRIDTMQVGLFTQYQHTKNFSCDWEQVFDDRIEKLIGIALL